MPSVIAACFAALPCAPLAAQDVSFADVAGVAVLQDGGGNRADASQAASPRSRIVIEQTGTGNFSLAQQASSNAATLEVLQRGVGNHALLHQFGADGGLLTVRQEGIGNRSNAVQQGAYATAAVLQSTGSQFGNASIQQSASAPIAIVEQGALASLQRQDLLAEANAVRRGQVAAAPAFGAFAGITQSGGGGLQAFVLQNATGAAASVSQHGAYLEATILQSGGAHRAGIVQNATGTADNPYRASIAQYGAQPQAITVTQTNQSPRTIRVVQQ